MEETDRILVERLVRQGDADAFSTLMGQYADMVYGTCRRVLGNDAQAADAAQETFFQFLKSADRITGSVGSWLHQVATRRAVDLVRQNVSRRRREQTYAASTFHQAEGWEEIEPQVDEALEELPDDLREFLILHYLKGQSMTEIAAAKGLSQPTVSRRVATALEQLRQKLGARDLAVGVTVLGTMLAQSAQSAPATVLQSLGKITLAQAASSCPTEVAVTAIPAFVAVSKPALAVAASIVAAGVMWSALHQSLRDSGPMPVPPTVLLRTVAVRGSNALQEKPDAMPIAGTTTASVVQPDRIPAVVPPQVTPGVGYQGAGGGSASFGFGGGAGGGAVAGGGGGGYVGGAWDFSRMGDPAAQGGVAPADSGLGVGPMGMPGNVFTGQGLFPWNQSSQRSLPPQARSVAGRDVPGRAPTWIPPVQRGFNAGGGG